MRRAGPRRRGRRRRARWPGSAPCADPTGRATRCSRRRAGGAWSRCRGRPSARGPRTARWPSARPRPGRRAGGAGCRPGRWRSRRSR
ncbi:hypothetical protein E8D34_12730 [Nocardioides sp. GY 10113]|nr:hypothetical protein E8D34_12730 [Nocardioides sp. GY 10113]